jgi:predicted transport protein
MEERKMILYKDAVKYIEYQYKNESEIEEMIFEHSKNIFGEDSLLLAKRKIRANSGIGAIPDAFVLSLGDKKWYLIEVELKNHPLYEHIVPQISKFNTALKNSDSQKKLIKMIYEEIKDDPQKNLMFQLKNIKEVYKYIAEILESKPQIIILIDGKNDELEEVCDSLPFDSKVIEFKTYIRENVGLGVHIHSFEPLKDFIKVTSVSKVGTVVEKVSREVKKYTEEDHTKKIPEKIVELYNELKEKTLDLADGIIIRPRKRYIGFVAKTNFTDVLLQKSKIKIWLNLKKGTIDDPKKVARDISNVGHWGNGDYEINISNDENLEYIISLVKQSYFKNK